MTSCSPQAITPLAIYIHWPFCASKCPYCDFNSHVRSHIDEAQWLKAFKLEIQRAAISLQSSPHLHQITSIFFGGGTPSLMPPFLVDGVIQEIAQIWGTNFSPEITLEGNPNSIEVGRLEGFRKAGVNRVSLGIQSLDDDALKFLGRTHSAKEGRKAIEIALSLFEEVSFDLIYARPQQTLDQWQKELEEALTFGTKHLSLYQLTIEEGTKFHTLYHRGDFALPPDQEAADFYDLTQEVTQKAGLPLYEISNHARKGSECRHNLTYWRYQDYLGIGPGAHGRLTINQQKSSSVQVRSPETWLTQSLSHGEVTHSPVTAFSPLSLEEQALEHLMMSLRTIEGLYLNRLPLPWEKFLIPSHLTHLVEKGQVVWNETTTHLRATSEGLKRLNGLLAYLLAPSQTL